MGSKCSNDHILKSKGFNQNSLPYNICKSIVLKSSGRSQSVPFVLDKELKVLCSQPVTFIIIAFTILGKTDFKESE